MGGNATVRPVSGIVGYDHELQRATHGVFLGDRRIGIILDSGSDWLNGTGPVRVEYRILAVYHGTEVPKGPFDSLTEAVTAVTAAYERGEANRYLGADGLSAFDRRALQFETTPLAQAADGRREYAITQQFGMDPTHYAQQVANLLRDRRPAAEAAFPLAVLTLDARSRRYRACRNSPRARRRP